MNGQPPPLPATKTSGLAITSLVLGILSLTCFGLVTGIPAIICGAIALSKIKNSAGTQAGQGLAIAGLCTGVVGMIVGTAILAAMLFPVFGRTREQACRVQCSSNLKTIGLAIAQYYDDHTNTMPRTFEDLRPYTGGSEKIFICPSAKDPTKPSYQLFPGVEWQANKTEPMVIELPTNHREGGNVLYNDGHVEWKQSLPTH